VVARATTAVREELGSLAKAAPGRRQEVLETAVTIFGTHGYRATSMNDIAAEVGLSKPALYHYFSGKEELLVSVFEDVLRDNITQARRIVTGGTSAGQALRQTLVERVAYTCNNSPILQVFYEEEAELPAPLRARVTQGRREYQQVLTDLIERGVAEGEFELSTTPTIVANSFIGACNWAYKWYQPGGPKSAAELGEDMAELLLRAIVVRRDAAGAGGEMTVEREGAP
jgi:TetR/AcrR family transcriptional regulator, cholesterol catabolism regulator